MIKISVPATSANLGPGFDCLGLAVNLYNEFFIEEIKEKLIIEGCKIEFCNEDNLFYQSYLRACEVLNTDIKGIRVVFDSKIPLKGGLGSSATCIVAGVAAAFILNDIEIDKKRILNISNSIEGHPDNVAPAILGAMVVSIVDEGEVYFERFAENSNFEFIGLSPSMELSTSESRGVIPKEVALKDAVFNSSRTTLLAMALDRGNIENIRRACEDKLHQQYRGKLIPNYFEIVDFAKKNGAITAFLSGAGPTIMIINSKGNKELASKLEEYTDLECKIEWTIRTLELDKQGLTINNYKLSIIN